ncbi:MAG: L,D-transpeptidase family protein [Eubacteriales bacterium]
MKKWFKAGSYIIIGSIVFVMLCYLMLAFYYTDRFPFHTWINGVYVTGKTVEELNEQLVEEMMNSSTDETVSDSLVQAFATIDDLEGIPDFAIITAEGTEYIAGETMQYTYDFTDGLNQYIIQQNPFIWGILFFKTGGSFNLQPQVLYDEKLLSEEIEQLVCIQSRNEDVSYEVEIILTEDGFELVDEHQLVLDTERAKEVILREVKAEHTKIDLVAYECYSQLSYSDQDKSVLELWEQINAYQEWNLTYLFGEDKEVVTPKEISQWILLEEDGNLSVDEEAVTEFIANLAEKYDTYNNHTFVTRDGEEVLITKGDYGNTLDQETEVSWLLENMVTRESSEREPVYLREETYKGQQVLGPNYIEIDLTNQKLYYVVDGIDQLETDIVTGSVLGGMATPAMVCDIYAKQKNRILTGATYQSFVYYWMPVYKGIGIHDATWRDEFGGDIYETSGSHGCINLPLEQVEILYDMVQVGTPVVIY